jgi:excisionase family DNA binding protein
MSHRDTAPSRAPLLDVSEAAHYLGVTPRFIRRLVAERRIAFIKLGRHLRFDATDLDEFVESGRVARLGPRRPA